MVIAADKSKDRLLMDNVMAGADLHSKLANSTYNIIINDLEVIPGYNKEFETPARWKVERRR